MEAVKNHVLEKLYGYRSPSQVIGLDSEFDQVFSALKNTVVQKRGYQCLLLGASATGKTMLVNKALERLAVEHANEYILVRINGLIHPDDKIALRSIAQQLDVVIKTGDDSIESVKMSQTMFNLNTLFESASLSNDPESKLSVVFVVEEFQKYCQMHQVLAYELLNLSQTCTFGVAFIGTSRRSNLIELLEKRNRSRINANSIMLSKPRSIADLTAIANSLLAIDDEKLVTEFPNEVKQYRKFLESPTAKSSIDAAVKNVFYTTNSAHHLCSQLQPLILDLTDLEDQDLMTFGSAESLITDYNNVAELDWAILICAARALTKLNTPTVNLVIVMDEWRAVASYTHIERYSTHAVTTLETPGSTKSSLLLARHAWDRLRKLGFFQPLHNTDDTHSELTMFVPEFDLEDIKAILPRTYSLYSWTDIN